MDTAGDGFFATFGEPIQAIECALDIRDAVAEIGITIRAGVHTGEVELGEKPGGLAVVIGARVMATAEPGEIRVSGTVRDVVAGADLTFADAGLHPLKGVPGEWHLFTVERVALDAEASDTVSASSQPAWTKLSPALLAGAAVTALGLGALVLVIVMVTTGDPGQAAGPNTVIRVDTGSNQVTGAVAVGDGPGAVAAGAGAVWVANLADRTISRIDPDAFSETARPGGVGAPTAMLVNDESVWVTDGFSGRLSVIDPRTNVPELVLEDLHGAAAMASGFSAIWVTDLLGDRVVRINARTREVEATIELEPDSGPIAIAAGADAVWVANELSLTLIRIDPGTNRVIGRAVDLCCRPSAIAVADAEIWVASRERDTVQRISGDRAAVMGTLDVGDGPSGIVVTGTAVWIMNQGEETLWRLNREGETVAVVDLPAQPGGLTSAEGALWVTLRSDGAVGYRSD